MNKNLKTIGTLRERATLLKNGNVVVNDLRVVHKRTPSQTTSDSPLNKGANVGAASSCPQKKGICAIYRGEKGITLIALIVTIIVLLILAMTTVSLVLRENLIEKAKIAKNEYQTAAQEESDALTAFEEEVNKIANTPSSSNQTEYGLYVNTTYYAEVKEEGETYCNYMIFSLENADGEIKVNAAFKMTIKDTGEIIENVPMIYIGRIVKNPSYTIGEDETKGTVALDDGYIIECPDEEYAYGEYLPQYKINSDGSLNYVYHSGTSKDKYYPSNINVTEQTSVPRTDIDFDQIRN